MDAIDDNHNVNNVIVGLDDNINNSEMNQENNQNQPNAIRGQPSNTNVMSGSNVRTSKPSSSNSAPCRAYEAAEFYRKRKEFQMAKIKEEEERLRRHKAKPMPNFKAIHSKAVTAVKETGDTCVVSPETPQVLRRGLAMKEKQKQKIKEHEQKQSARPPIEARPTTVLTEEPFKPKLETHHQLKVEPFKLKMSERILQRKKFDQNYQCELAKKKEKEEQQKKEEEEKTRQAVRERTTFKARPNPFKMPEQTE